MKYSITLAMLLTFCLTEQSYSQGRLQKLKDQIKAAASGPDLSSDPNYFYASHPATHSDDFTAVDGYLITKEQRSGKTYLDAIFGKGKDAGSTSPYYSTIESNERLTELYGKPAYIGQSYCIQEGEELNCAIKPGDDRKGRTLEAEEGVFLFYGGELTFSQNGTTYFPYIADFTSESIDKQTVLVMAKTSEKLAEWTQERAKKEVAALEDKIREKVKGESADYLANVHMVSNFSRAEGMVRALCEKDGTTFKELVLTSNSWKIVNKPGTQIIDYRIFMGYFADYNPDEDHCVIHTVSFRENYSGGNYSGDWFIAGVGQDPNVGPVVDCNNVGN